MERWVCGLALLAATPAWAGGDDRRAPIARDLTAISLEELMNVEVTSVCRKEQKLSRTAAAVYVIAQKDIRRSGATSIPEVLRMAPGVQVARIDANKWAISVRGFNGRYSNKLLVLIDGRSVYTPLYSGVYWDIQDTVLEDIERIEVIRGPGATMWGANAVNGVINIITKHTRDTEGVLITAGGGNEEKGSGAVRYGFPLGRDVKVRVYAKHFHRNHLEDRFGQSTGDQWRQTRGGFRMDGELSRRDSLMLESEVYSGRAGEQVTMPVQAPPFVRDVDGVITPAGGSLLTRWQRRFSEKSDLALQFYYDHSQRGETSLRAVRDTFDFDFQHRFTRSRHEILWGLGQRFSADDITNSFAASLDPKTRQDRLSSSFVQDEIRILEDRLGLTAGAKLEHNSYTGFEAQPNVRLWWAPGRHQNLWAAVSRAVRTPSRMDQDMRLNVAVFPGPGGLNMVSIFGDPHFRSETLMAYELGYRWQAARRVSVDLAAFYNRYQHLRTQDSRAPFFEQTPAPPHLVLPTYFGNQMNGHTHGVEVSTQWRLSGWWRWDADYSWLRLDLRQGAGSRALDVPRIEGSSPKHQLHLHSYLDLPGRLQFDTGFYYVDRLAAFGIPSYLRADLRLGWRPTATLELSLGAENLLDNRHPEFSELLQGSRTVAEVGRNVYGKVTWRFR